jgi:hypothetical protein
MRIVEGPQILRLGGVGRADLASLYSEICLSETSAGDQVRIYDSQRQSTS